MRNHQILKHIMVVTFCTFIFGISNVFAQQRMRDVVYLKNGSVIRGIIIEQVPNVSIKIQTSDGSVFAYKMDEIEKLAKEPFWDERGKKSAGLAFLYSFLVPGLGQHYNGQHTKGAIQEITFIVGFFMMISDTPYDKYWWDPGSESWGSPYTVTPDIYWAGLSIMCASYLWSVIDAPISANKINEKRMATDYGHLIEFNKDKYALGFDVTTPKNGIGARVTLHF